MSLHSQMATFNSITYLFLNQKKKLISLVWDIDDIASLKYHRVIANCYMKMLQFLNDSKDWK